MTCPNADALLAVSRLASHLDWLDHTSLSQRESEERCLIARVMRRTHLLAETPLQALTSKRERLAAEYARLHRIGDRIGAKKVSEELKQATHEMLRAMIKER